MIWTKKGEQVKAVRGLGKGDFTILDNGKPQQISVFSTESGQASPASSRFLPANVFSNRVARTGDIPANAVAILLDGAETSFADSVIVRNAIIKFLRGMSAGDRVALYALAREIERQRREGRRAGIVRPGPSVHL